ncbi:hypothetical protein [Celeribacter sp.]|uniref:hypothetical protein n=1 Tax=Celeribacter sp. TaxID=1890673 RepID=UPI003A958F69
MRLLMWHGSVEISTRWQTAFGTRGHYVRRARSEEEAMELLRSEPFDLLIFDLVVGGESGLAVALLAEFHQPQAVAILVSEHDPVMQHDLFSRLGNLRAVQGASTTPEDLVAIAESVVNPNSTSCATMREQVPNICDTCTINDICPEAQVSEACERAYLPELVHEGTALAHKV